MALMVMMTAWSVASAVCSSSWLMLSFSGFVLSSVILLLALADDSAGVFIVLGTTCYVSSFSTMYLIWVEALPMLAYLPPCGWLSWYALDSDHDHDNRHMVVGPRCV